MASPIARLPRSRPPEHLVVEELPGELLVYDTVAKSAHCLNKTAALVWRHCDGETTVDEMAAHLEADGLPRDPRVVELALVELARARLIESREEAPSAAALRSRRDALKKIAFISGVAVALPLVQSIVAPSVAHAASNCIESGKPCNNPNRVCCSGTCLPNGRCL